MIALNKACDGVRISLSSKRPGRGLINGINDELILAARLLLATLFLIFGWRKLRDFSGTVSQMAQLGVPMPVLAAGVATFMELPVAFAVAVGAFTRPSALLMFFYTLGTALLGIAIGKQQMRITLTAWTAFTKISALWEASCCCTLPEREIFDLMVDVVAVDRADIEEAELVEQRAAGDEAARILLHRQRALLEHFRGHALDDALEDCAADDSRARRRGGRDRRRARRPAARSTCRCR